MSCCREILKKDLAANNAKFFHRSFWLFLFLRAAQYSSSKIIRTLSKVGKKIVLIGTCCEIPTSARYGGGLYMPHLNGIVISPFAQFGDNVKILQQVTVGVDFEKDSAAAPTVGDNVLLGAGSKVIGSVQIAPDVRVGANAVVTKSVLEACTVIGSNIIISRSDGQ